MPLQATEQVALAAHLHNLATRLDKPRELNAPERGEILAIIAKLLEQFGPVLIQLLIDLFLKHPESTQS